MNDKMVKSYVVMAPNLLAIRVLTITPDKIEKCKAIQIISNKWYVRIKHDYFWRENDFRIITDYKGMQEIMRIAYHGTSRGHVRED